MTQTAGRGRGKEARPIGADRSARDRCLSLSLRTIGFVCDRRGRVRDPFPGFREREIDHAARSGGLGVALDIALALCERLNAECTFVRQGWEGLVPALGTGSFDTIVSSMSITGNRWRPVAFAGRYYSNVVRFVARKDWGFDPEAPAGRNIGAARATVSSTWLGANHFGVADIRLFTELGAPLRALVEGRLDAVFGDGLGFWNWLRSPKGASLGDFYWLDESIGITVRKEDEASPHRLNQALKRILADRTYSKINAR